MRLIVRLAFGLAVFLAVVGVVYAVTAGEPQGAILLLVCSAASVYIGVSLRGGFRRDKHAGDADEEEEEGQEEPEEIEQTIWPFVASIAALMLVIGIVGIHWVLVVAAILFVATAAGWFVDIQRQRVHSAEEASTPEGQVHPDDHDRH